MNVSVEENSKNKKEYPYIGIATNNGMIVLFTSQCTGTLICFGESMYNETDIGYHTDKWIESAFIHYDGKVTLEN